MNAETERGDSLSPAGSADLEWEALNEERFALIEKKVARQATRSELKGLANLQRDLARRQRIACPWLNPQNDSSSATASTARPERKGNDE